MSFFDDFKKAVDDYLTTEVQISFSNVDFPGDVINVDEVCKFTISVTNFGHLDMTDVKLYIEGLNGTKVSSSNTGPWSSSIYVESNLTVDAGGDSTPSHYLYFKAPSSAQPVLTTLVSAHIYWWKASLKSLLDKYSAPFFPLPIGHYMNAVNAS